MRTQWMQPFRPCSSVWTSSPTSFGNSRKACSEPSESPMKTPEMALTRARKVLEHVVRDVYERRVEEPPGTRPLENLLQRLVKDGYFPDRLDAYATAIRKLGNVGTHSFGEKVTVADVYQSLTQLMPILEWYFETERPDAVSQNPTLYESDENSVECQQAGITPLPKAVEDKRTGVLSPKDANEPAPIALWQQGLLSGLLTAELAYDDTPLLRQLGTVIVHDLQEHAFSEEDQRKTVIVLNELVSNVRHASDPHKMAKVSMCYEKDSVCLSVEDRGPGFDFYCTIRDLTSRLMAGGREHGLLRAMRYGTSIEQRYGDKKAHSMLWRRCRRPVLLPSIFDEVGLSALVVYDYEDSAIRIARDIYTVDEFYGFSETSRFALIFEPLRRSGGPFVGFEVRGAHSTVFLGFIDVLRPMWQYLKAQLPKSRVMIFADTELEDHRLLSELCHGRVPVEWLLMGENDPRLSPVVQTMQEIAASGLFTFFDVREVCVRFLRAQLPTGSPRPKF